MPAENAIAQLIGKLQANLAESDNLIQETFKMFKGTWVRIKYTETTTIIKVDGANPGSGVDRESLIIYGTCFDIHNGPHGCVVGKNMANAVRYDKIDTLSIITKEQAQANIREALSWVYQEASDCGLETR